MDGYSDKGKFTPKPNCPTPTTCRLAGECQGGCIRKGRARISSTVAHLRSVKSARLTER